MANQRNVQRRSRSVKVWLGPANQGYVSVASASKVLLASTAGFGLGAAGTILRSRGVLSVRPTGESADLAFDGAFGIAVISDVARATGITAIPGPFTDSDWSGWLVHQFWAQRIAFEDATGVQFNAALNYEIDSKAMRKVQGDEAIVLVAEARLGAVGVLSHIRMLFQES